MKIASLTLEGVLGAPDGTFSFLDKAGQCVPVVLFRGESRAGKTSVLRAIAAAKEQAGAYGAPPRPSAFRKRGRASGRIDATWLLSEEEQELGGLGEREHRTELILDDEAVQPLVDPGLRKVFTNVEGGPGLGGLELVPPGRHLAPGAEPLPGVRDASLRARETADKYAGLGGWIVDRVLADGAATLRTVTDRGVVGTWDRTDSLGPVREAIARLLPHLRLGEVEPRLGGYVIRFDRDDGARLDLFDLSSSELDAVLLAIVLRRRSHAHGMLLVDEPALTLGPRDRTERFLAITALATDAQVLAASSASELAGVHAGQLDLALDDGARRGGSR